MLPGSDSIGIAYHNRIFSGSRPNNIGHQPILCPITAPDDISSPRTRYQYFVLYEERPYSARSALDPKIALTERRTWIVLTDMKTEVTLTVVGDGQCTLLTEMEAIAWSAS